MAEQKNSVVAATENKNIKPSYYYILKTMKVIVNVEKRYQFIKGFYFANKDDLPESDRTKVKVMMDLAKIQLKQKQGA